MVEYSKEFRRVHKSIWLALALLLVFSLLLQNVAGSVYYSLLMEPKTTVTAPPVVLQDGIAGNSTIYTNSTSAKVSVDTLPVENMNWTSDATGWVYGESADTVATGAWDPDSGRTDPGCYNLTIVDDSAGAFFSIDQFINYSFTVDTLPFQTIVYGSVRLTSNDDFLFWAEIRLVRPDNSVATVWVGDTYSDNIAFDSGWINVTVDATSNFTLTGTYQLSLFTHSETDDLGSASTKCTLVHYWDDAGVKLTLDSNYVLKVVNQVADPWEVRLKAYDNSSIARLNNCSIYIYDGSNSTQIVILNGAYDQQTGPWYDLAASDTEYIWIHVETSSAGTSYVYAYLEIRVPTATTYARYIITFRIT